MKPLLVTFGCSWTYGVGVGYQASMSKSEFEKIAWDDTLANQYSFRGILSKKYQLINRNFSVGGSSNQKQFRLAENFFISDEFADLQKTHKIIVLWGITSTTRNELYCLASNGYPSNYRNFFYGDKRVKDWPFPENFIQYSYDHSIAVQELAVKMKFWNIYFKNNGITNLWFDSFNTHDYQSNIQNMLFKQDLLSILSINYGLECPDSNYHLSCNFNKNTEWQNDSNRITHLVKENILDPISYHPTKLGHQSIAELMSPEIEKLL